MKLKDWFEKNCRTASNQLVCVHRNKIKVLSPLDEETARKPATKENINKFLNKNTTYKEIK